jgi:predicted ATP-dependent endonuclease of OLD family
MPRIRKIEIQNFRGIKDFAWLPSAGINCLIGPGDSGKSSILDAIDYCVGARRNIQFSDDVSGMRIEAADIHAVDVHVLERVIEFAQRDQNPNGLFNVQPPASPASG